MHAPRVTHVFGARVCRVPIVNIDPPNFVRGRLWQFHDVREILPRKFCFRAPIIGARLFRASYTPKLYVCNVKPADIRLADVVDCKNSITDNV